jgi:hypothetical protein
MFKYLALGAVTAGISYQFHKSNKKAIFHGIIWPFMLIYALYTLVKMLGEAYGDS